MFHFFYWGYAGDVNFLVANSVPLPLIGFDLGEAKCLGVAVILAV